MLIKVITIVFDSAYGGFNDNEVREFLKDKDLVSSAEHFFVRNDIPYLAFILKYFPHREELSAKSVGKAKSSQPSEAWRESLSEHDMGLFNLLRDWRSERCKKDGVPPYVVFNNKELAEIVKRRPQTLSDLTQIEGIGKAKAQKYGDEVLTFTKITDSQAQSSLPMAEEENGSS